MSKVRSDPFKCKADFKNARDYLAKSDIAKEFLDQLEKSKDKYYVNRTDDGAHQTKDRKLKWDPKAATKTKKGTQSPAMALLHELKHAELPGSSFEQDEIVVEFQNTCAKQLGEDKRFGHEDWEFAFRVDDPTKRLPIGPPIKLPDTSLPKPPSIPFPK